MADIHGNLPALEAALSDVDAHAVDGVVVAGDIACGIHQNEIVRRLRSLGCFMIRGNGDNYLLHFDAAAPSDPSRASRQWAFVRWCYGRIERETLDFLAALPEQRVVALPGTAPIRVVHGSPRHVNELIYPDRDPARLDAALALVDEPVLVCAHTHIPWKVQRGDRLALNPGAICGPVNGDVRAQYALLDWDGVRWRATHRAVPYDLDRVRADFQESGVLEAGGAYARAILLNIETGRNVAGDLLAHVFAVAEKAGLHDRRVIPDAIWDAAAATFRWDELPG